MSSSTIGKWRRSFDSSPTSALAPLLVSRTATPTHSIIRSPTTIALMRHVTPIKNHTSKENGSASFLHADITLQEDETSIIYSSINPMTDAKKRNDNENESDKESPMPTFVDDRGRDIFAVRTPSSMLFGEARDITYQSDGVEDDDIDHNVCSDENLSKNMPSNWRICTIFTGQIVEDLQAHCHRPQSSRGRSFSKSSQKQEKSTYFPEHVSGRRGRREPKVVNGRVWLSRREWNAYNSFYNLFMNSNNEDEDPTMPVHMYKRYMVDLKKDHGEQKRKQTRGWKQNLPTIEPSAEEKALLMKKLQTSSFGSNRSFTEESVNQTFMNISTNAENNTVVKDFKSLGNYSYSESSSTQCSSFFFGSKPEKQKHSKMEKWNLQSLKTMNRSKRNVGGAPLPSPSQHWYGRKFKSIHGSVNNPRNFFNNRDQPN